MSNFRTLSVGLAVLGLMGGTALAAWFGFAPIGKAILSVGGAGFVLFSVWQLATMALLGVGWWLVAPDSVRSLPALIWGRMVRDSAGSCLPFSQVGGFLLGARAASLHGLAWGVVTISMVVDLTAEFISELIFAAAGLLVLLRHMADGTRTLPLAAATAGALGLGYAVFRLHGKVLPVLVRFGERVLGDWARGGLTGASAGDLAALYSQSGRLVAAILVHLLGWVAKGVGNWLAFRLLGADLSLIDALAIEGLLHALLIPAFVIPGYAGVQEAGYAGLGALFGLSPEISIGVSLLRRARDIALGIPILLAWQLWEVKRLRIQG
jgi:putative membrane protein